MAGFVKKTLAQLIAETAIAFQSWSAPLTADPVTFVTDQSDQVRPGAIFVAIKGGSVDGHAFIDKAIENGAIAVVGSSPLQQSFAVPYGLVEDARAALAYLAAAFYNFPARQMVMLGVTGTDGKTTTSNFIYHILQAAGLPVGIISTVNAMIGAEVIDTGLHTTTPTAPEIQRYLARMNDAGLSHVVLEATSHGLAQHRATGCDFDIGVITNITHEHLDYHGSFEAYRAAKTRLFTNLGRVDKPFPIQPLAVLNGDDPLSYDYLLANASAPCAVYALEARAGVDVWAEEIRHDAHGLHFFACGKGFREPIHCRLMGLFNVSNCLAAITAAVMGLRLPPSLARQGIAAMRGVPGRMEQIAMGQPFVAMVDFAHTPNAMMRLLEAARAMTNGRVIAVFGSAGLRDREKRRMMAETAAQLADVAILTAEDPRTESLDVILAEMAAGAVSRGGVEGQSFYRVPDRAQAIRQALHLAQPGDVVVSCGKGHEQSMCFGTTEYPWDDRIAMRAALAELLHATGPQMPYLPTQEESWK